MLTVQDLKSILDSVKQEKNEVLNSGNVNRLIELTSLETIILKQIVDLLESTNLKKVG